MLVYDMLYHVHPAGQKLSSRSVEIYRAVSRVDLSRRKRSRSDRGG